MRCVRQHFYEEQGLFGLQTAPVMSHANFRLCNLGDCGKLPAGEIRVINRWLPPWYADLMFTPRRVAQMAAFFAHKQGGTINVLKLMKLLYLSDREAMNHCGLPISYDNMVSMPDGPVLSRSLNLINGSFDAESTAKWEEWISDRENHDVELKRSFERRDLDQLSDADIEVLEKVWGQFGWMDKYALRDWTHENCPEWVDPEGSSFALEEFDLLTALGKSPQEARELADSIMTERTLDRVLAKL